MIASDFRSTRDVAIKPSAKANIPFYLGYIDANHSPGTGRLIVRQTTENIKTILNVFKFT